MNTNEHIAFDNEGYLVHPEDWNSTIAQKIAEDENIHLNNEDHEQYNIVIQFMRQYWLEHQVAPDVRHVTKYLSEKQNIDKKTAKQMIFKLFPYGYVKQACKISGMKRPRGWSTG